MAFSSRSTRFVNPRLGTYFGIFASSLTGLVLLLMIFEQLGTSEIVLRWAMLLGPLVLYAAVGLCVPTRKPLEFFAAGRRVPAGYTGLGLANAAMGATGVVAMTGIFFIIGFDALCLVIGGLAGFVIMAIMLAPFFRKVGAFTVPSYLGRRFESRLVRLFSAALLSVPMLLLVAAELRMGASAAGWLVGRPEGLMIVMLVVALLVTVILGGMRSLTWSSSAEAIAATLALIVPVAIVAVMVTNFPLPQLTHGPLLRALVHSEAAQGLPVIDAPSLSFLVPDDGYAAIAKRFTVPFGSVGRTAFVIVTLTVMAGVAASPWLLPRVSMTPGVYETRKSLGWATVFFGLTMLTAASISVYMRDFVMDIVKDGAPTTLPDWMHHLVDLGFVHVDTASRSLHFTSFMFARDKVLLSLPIAAGLPAVFVYFAAAGIIAAALVAAGAATVALGNVLAEDVINGMSWEPLPRDARLGLGRVAIVAVAVVGGAIALVAPTDPLRLLLWSLALTGSTLFPVLVLSIWWKRMNAFGALAGLACGFTVAVLTILAGETSILGLDGALAGVLGLPAGALGALLASTATPGPSRSMLELVREIRIPGGEVVYDREMRLSRLKNRERT
jgi:cation/acetate symporter